MESEKNYEKNSEKDSKMSGERNRRPAELLAPAGSLDCLKAALDHGADAVYMGGPRFGARAYADNPDTADLVRALDYVHMKGKKLYMTVNTLLKEEELAGLYDYLLPFYEAGLDAVLVQDLGVLRRIRRDFPDLPVHASTQMTVTDAEGARALAALGVSRVVAARELSLPELKAIADTGIELEAFAHGAICYCYSGQCLLSSLIGGRSGNRGRCAGPCRLPYDVLADGKTVSGRGQNYVLNLKDMDTLSFLPQMRKAGVISFKIEGRMKSPRYTGGVTAIYRKYLDLGEEYLDACRKSCEAGAKYRVDEEDRRFLRELFDRGGYTEYVSAGTRAHMVAVGQKPEFRAPDEAFLQEKEKSFPVSASKENIKGKLRFYTGEPVIITMESKRRGVSVTAEGPVVLEAKNRPLDEAALREKFSRLGDTPFAWEELSVETDRTGFLPVGALNELRRRAAGQLEEKILEQYHRNGGQEREEICAGDGRQAVDGRPAGAAKASDSAGPAGADCPAWSAGPAESVRPAESPCLPEKTEIRAAVDTFAQFRTALSYPGISAVYLNLSYLTDGELDRVIAGMKEGESHPPVFAALPPVLRASMKEDLGGRIEKMERAGLAGCLVHTLDQAAWIKRRFPSLSLRAEASLYTYNKEAAAFLLEAGFAEAALPVELNGREIQERLSGTPLPAELTAYGYLPAMVSAQCVKRTVSGCDKKGSLLQLKDRLGKRFTVRCGCRYCFNVIYNSEPLYLLDLRGEWQREGLAGIRLQFTIEDEKEMRRILDACLPALLRGQPAANPLSVFTRGHFRRGVE